MNIPIIGEQKQPTFPLKKIDVLPDGGVLVQILLAPDIITSTIILTPQDMTAIDQLRVSMRAQQRADLQLVKHVFETKN
jgi:hypothetical protein